MRFLFITKDWSKGIEKNTVYLSHELAKLTDYVEWREPGDLKQIVRKLPHKPDFILLNDLRPTRCPEITGLRGEDIPIGIIMHDLNHQPEKRKTFIRDNGIRHLFVHYRSYFNTHYAEFRDRMIWFPHWVNTQVFKDYGLPKTYEYLLMGCVEKNIYPMRSLIVERMQQEPGFVYHPHPGYHQGTYNETDHIVGARYAKEINRTKIFLTDQSVYGYLFMKYFEVPACNTLLLAPDSPDARALGFVPSENFVDIKEGDFLEKARYYAQNYETEGKRIAQKGYEMVRKLHSVERRARQLVAAAEKIIKEGK